MDAEPIRTPRLTLEPLAVEHAPEMAEALDDPALHTFIGGSPATAGQLRDRYTRMVAGPPAGGDDAWLNWVIRLDGPDCLVGYVQATVTSGRASVAWVVGTPWQGRGIAGEAALALTGWLGEHGVHALVATVHPDHAASSAVARRIGLVPTDGRVDGEVVWRSE
ncbi:RimJ/RimL family protein N-acetyltransferase [Streptosporangium album]|uniref:RimJ/RimL family protein N-acetyltransferase n=1 Tax=Streptosporangium album TaxID=47479 RepID=A0A7W7WCA8_9ACTN|nr:GNAT family N-acetyltransferase [Streptosporangium album]MBB4941054.1 RimJ/RimL family protein N-acetyltransferase [Streptosporangium album]